MATDTGRNANDKVKKLMRAMLIIAKRKNEDLSDYLEELVNDVIKFLKVKKYNMNIVLLLQNILREFVPNGIERVPEALRTIKKYVKGSPSYLNYL